MKNSGRGATLWNFFQALSVLAHCCRSPAGRTGPDLCAARLFDENINVYTNLRPAARCGWVSESNRPIFSTFSVDLSVAITDCGLADSTH
jgi:hypothetical protein